MTMFPNLHTMWTSSTSDLTFIELLVLLPDGKGRRYAIALHTELGDVWEAEV